MSNYEFSPEIWFDQSEDHMGTNKYIYAYLVCGQRWQNKPLVRGKRFDVHIRDSFDILSDYYTKGDPYQSIIHPIVVRLSLRDHDDQFDPMCRKENLSTQVKNFYLHASLPKEIPEIKTYAFFVSHAIVAKDCQEYGYSTEVATAILYWAYKIAGMLDGYDNLMDYPTGRVIPYHDTIDRRMVEIHECYPDMWKVAAFSRWPKWERDKVKLDERVEILKNLGFRRRKEINLTNYLRCPKFSL